MKKFSLVLMVAVMFFAVNALAAPCVTPKVTPAEIVKWKVVDRKMSTPKLMIVTAVNPDPNAKIRASMFMVSQIGVVRYCFLDDGVFKDFFFCKNCRCWHKTNLLLIPPTVIARWKKMLMDALNGDNVRK